MQGMGVGLGGKEISVLFCCAVYDTSDVVDVTAAAGVRNLVP